MTGEEHWLEAERLLADAQEFARSRDLTWPENRVRYEYLVQLASVHAQLAASAPGYGFHREKPRYGG